MDLSALYCAWRLSARRPWPGGVALLGARPPARPVRRRLRDGSPATQSAVLTSVALEHVGKASGAFSLIRQLGGAFGVAVQVAVFAAAGSYASADAVIAGVGPALGTCAALALLGATAGTRLRARRRAAVVQVAVAQG
jgi:hypothetical protein